MTPDFHAHAGDRTIVLSMDGFEPYASLGSIIYDKPKHFHYDWHVEYMTADDLESLRDAIDAAIAYLQATDETVRSDCRGEQA